MPWIEERQNTWLIRDRVDGKKVTLGTFDDEREARYFLRLRRPMPMTSSEAISRLQESMGTPRKRSPKLADYARELVESDTNIREGTRDGYEHVLRNHLAGTPLGNTPISEITPADVRRFWLAITPKKAGPAGGKGVQINVFQLLAKVLNQAIRDSIIVVSPLAQSGIRKPSKRRATEVIPLEIDRIEELAAATTNERDRLMILLGGYCGLRGGEVGGLRVVDVDGKDCTFYIRQAVKGSGTKKHLGLPKGDKTRKIAVPCSLAAEVVEFAKGNAAPDGRIFHADGMIGSSKTNEVCQEAAKRVGSGPVNFHALRHSMASLLVASGATVLDVCAYLGHSSPEVTLRVYAHLFQGSDRALAESMEARRADYRKRIKSL